MRSSACKLAVVVFLSACGDAALDPLRPDELARLDEFKRCMYLGTDNGLHGGRYPGAAAFCNAEAVRRALSEAQGAARLPATR